LNLEYEYKLLDADYTVEELFKLVPEARTFPQVFIDGKPIGGFVELKNILQQGAG
jgi:glutaredoxin